MIRTRVRIMRKGPRQVECTRAPDAFHQHPGTSRSAGYAAYAEAIKTKLPDGWLDKQDRLV